MLCSDMKSDLNVTTGGLCKGLLTAIMHHLDSRWSSCIAQVTFLQFACDQVNQLLTSLTLIAQYGGREAANLYLLHKGVLEN